MSLRLIAPFVVNVSSPGQHEHWQGGPVLHDGAACPRCNKRLILFWNLDATDGRFVSRQGRHVFKGIERLFLYWCPRCGSAIDYSIEPTGNLRLLAMNGLATHQVPQEAAQPNFPYRDYPHEYERRRISIVASHELPKTVRDLLTVTPIPKLTDARKVLLERHVGHAVSARGFELMRTWIHQLGGAPYLPQGDQHVVCQKPECRRRGQRMKFLAAIKNDPPGGLPIAQPFVPTEASESTYYNHFITVYFHICSSCRSIHAESQGS